MRAFRFRDSLTRKTRLLLVAAAGALGLAVAIPLNVGHASPSAVPTDVSALDTRLLNDADQALIRDCMRQRGFEYWPISLSQIDPAPRFAYVVTSQSWARTHGLGGVPGGAPKGADPNQRYFDRLAVSQQNMYSDALVGVGSAGPTVTVALPTGGVLGHSALGCQAKAGGELYGSFRAWFRASSIADDLPPLWQGMVVNDSRYREALAAWSRCIGARGFSYSSPEQAAAAFQRAGSVLPSRAEIRVAVAEAACAGSTGLAGVASHLNREFSAAVQRQYRSSLYAEWRLEHSALPRARDISSSHSTG